MTPKKQAPVGSISNGKQVRALSKGAVMGSGRGNEVIRGLNALLTWKIQMVDGQTPSLEIADAGVSLSIPRGQAQAGTSLGGVQYKGEYGDTVDYVANDLVFTNEESGDRVPWICEIANGPSTAVHAPTWLEPGTIYWRCLAHFEGGGGTVTLYTLISINMAGNYLVCRPDGGAGDGSDDIKVALQPELRNTISSQTIDGETWTYSYDDQRRTASYSDLVENQVITPRFLAGDIVPVTRCLNTGVTVSGTELTYISITGREWAKEPDVYTP